MNASRAGRWLWALAIAFFSAGLVVGLATSVATVRGATADPMTGADRDYVTAFASRYALDSGQQADLEKVLASRQQELARILRRHYQDIPEAVKQEVQAVDQRADLRILVLLDEEQKRRYLSDGGVSQK